MIELPVSPATYKVVENSIIVRNVLCNSWQGGSRTFKEGINTIVNL